MIFFPSLGRLLSLLAIVAGCLLADSAHAQLLVDLKLKRRLFMINEPVLATVTMSNQSGRDVVLADTQEGGPWFSFQITATDGRMVPPRNPNYDLQPLALHAGETVKRTVNLNELYAMGDYGAYRVKASIFFAPTGKYFGSRLVPMELSDGRQLWYQTVGVPEGAEGGGGYRKFSLLTMEHDGRKLLYVRVAGEDDNTVYGCYNLGPILDGHLPDAKFDGGNNIAVLQLVGPKTYLLSRVGVNGNFISQATYVTPRSQPYLRRQADGALQIVGATRQATVAQTQPADAPKLSDRPPGF